jgi:hypothetical protein
MSGLLGEFVYYIHNGEQRWHRYAVPRDPRTAAQQRSRKAFGAAAKAWSQSEPLTEEQRDAWREAAAKIKSSPRLWLWGPLTGQQHFVGCNSVKERHGLALLLEPPGPGRKKEEGRMENAESTPQVQQYQEIEQSISGTGGACAVPAASERAAGPRECGQSLGQVGPVACRQGSGGTTEALRGGSRKCLLASHLRRYRMGVGIRSGIFGSLKRSLRRGEAGSTRGCRELWRGG